MPPIVFQLLAQPWALPALIGMGAFLLGLLLPRRNGGSSWLSGIVFFLPHLFLDLLDLVHTKKFKYYGLVTALLAIEAFFAFRAATVYYDVLNTRMPAPEMAIVCVIVCIAVFLCGYMVATHGGTWNVWRVCTMVFVIFHDWAGTIWMNYSQPLLDATSATAATGDQVSNDGLKLVLTIGMCVLGMLPFIMGAWAEELRPQLEQELDEEVDTFTSKATRQIKRRAVNRVLRLANRTDIVRLVRALPASEFTSFKQFVMPIIAPPGTPYQLSEVSEGPAAGQPLPLPAAIGQNGSDDAITGQPATDQQSQRSSQPQPTLASANRPMTPLTAHLSSAALDATNQAPGHDSVGPDRGGPDKLERTVAYLAAHPQATDDELAAHLGMSRPASALFYRRKALEMLGNGKHEPIQASPVPKAVSLGLIERMMYNALQQAPAEQQAELRRRAESQSLAEFTQTLQQRWPQYASQITEARVATVLAYDRTQQAATKPPREHGQQATADRAATGHQNELATLSEIPGQEEVAPSTGPDSGQPARVIDMSGHRPPRPAGHHETLANRIEDTDDQMEAASDHLATESEVATDEQDEDNQGTKARVAAYRTTHPSETQKQAAEALGVSARTVRRYWSTTRSTTTNAS